MPKLRIPGIDGCHQDGCDGSLSGVRPAQAGEAGPGEAARRTPRLPRRFPDHIPSSFVTVRVIRNGGAWPSRTLVETPPTQRL